MVTHASLTTFKSTRRCDYHLTLPYLTLPYSPHPTLPYPTLLTLPYPTLPYSTYPTRTCEYHLTLPYPTLLTLLPGHWIGGGEAAAHLQHRHHPVPVSQVTTTTNKLRQTTTNTIPGLRQGLLLKPGLELGL